MYTALVCDDEKFQREGLARHVRWTEHGFDAPILCASAWESAACDAKHKRWICC